MTTLLLGLCTTAALGIGKVMVDPNTPDKVVPADGRVNQKITYAAKRQFVSRTLADLSERSGVTLSAGFNDQDWQVRDRRMTVIVKDVPLRELMDSIARTMKFLWKSEGDPAKPSYRLFMDRRAVLLVEAEKTRQARLIETMQARARERLLYSIEYAAGLNDAETEELRERDPYTYMLAKSGIAAGIDQLFRACPETRKTLATGERVKYVPSLSPEIVAAAHTVEAGMSFRQSVPYDQDLSTRNVGNVLLNNFSGLDRELVGRITIYYEDEGRSQSDLVLWDPTSTKAQLMGERMAALWESPPEQHQKINDEYDKQEGSIKPPDWSTLPADTVEPLAKHPDDPELEKAIDLTLEDGKEYGQEDFAELLAEKCGVNAVAEAYVGGLPKASPGAMKMESIRQLLDLMQDKTQCNWWKRGSIIEIRSRHWYEARTWQIPEAWLEQWRTTFRTAGTLDIDDLCRIAALTWNQIAGNVLTDPVLTCAKGHDCELSALLSDHMVELSIYGMLTRRQRALVFSRKGLDLLSVPAFMPALNMAAGLPDSLWLGPSELKGFHVIGKREPKGRAWVYNFGVTVATPDGRETMKTGFTTPIYTKQKQEPEPESSPAPQ